MQLLDCRDPALGAALFHAGLAEGLAAWAAAAVDHATGLNIAIAGGCAMNVVLTSALRRQLAARGLTLCEAHLAPPNDGGLALGQAWLARQLVAAT